MEFNPLISLSGRLKVPLPAAVWENGGNWAYRDAGKFIKRLWTNMTAKENKSIWLDEWVPQVTWLTFSLLGLINFFSWIRSSCFESQGVKVHSGISNPVLSSIIPWLFMGNVGMMPLFFFYTLVKDDDSGWQSIAIVKTRTTYYDGVWIVITNHLFQILT